MTPIRYTSNSLRDDQVDAFNSAANAIETLANSRERDQALIRLDEAFMWAEQAATAPTER